MGPTLTQQQRRPFLPHSHSFLPSFMGFTSRALWVFFSSLSSPPCMTTLLSLDWRFNITIFFLSFQAFYCTHLLGGFSWATSSSLPFFLFEHLYVRASTHLFNGVLLAPKDLVFHVCKPFFEMGSFVFKCMDFEVLFGAFCRSWLHSWVGSLRMFNLHFWLKASDLFSFCLMYDFEWKSF